MNKRDYSAISRFIKTAGGCTFVQFKYRCTTEIKINNTINPIFSLITVHSLLWKQTAIVPLGNGRYMFSIELN